MAVVDARPGNEVKYRAIDADCSEAAIGHGTDVDHPAEPTIRVVSDLTTSAICVEGRKQARVRIESDVVVAQEGFHLGSSAAAATKVKVRTAANITMILRILVRIS